MNRCQQSTSPLKPQVITLLQDLQNELEIAYLFIRARSPPSCASSPTGSPSCTSARSSKLAPRDDVYGHPRPTPTPRRCCPRSRSTDPRPEGNENPGIILGGDPPSPAETFPLDAGSACGAQEPRNGALPKNQNSTRGSTAGASKRMPLPTGFPSSCHISHAGKEVGAMRRSPDWLRTFPSQEFCHLLHRRPAARTPAHSG